MKVLFATKNPAKIKRYSNKLEEKGVQVLTLQDIDINLQVEENGKNALENAYLKAKAYYDATGIISIGIDDTLFIEGLPDEKQPGTNVRRVNGKELSDDEIRKTIISLYFKNIETNTLIAEAKCIDVKKLYTEPYSYLINMLIAGPENEKLESAIPEGTKVNSCTLKGNTLYVDLSREFIDNAPTGIKEESMVIYSIVNTLTELNEVSGVKFLINGEEDLQFKDGKISLKEIFVKND